MVPLWFTGLGSEPADGGAGQFTTEASAKPAVELAVKFPGLDPRARIAPIPGYHLFQTIRAHAMGELCGGVLLNVGLQPGFQ